jgi:hypothetical protein
MVEVKKVKEESSVDSALEVRVAACSSLSYGNCDTPVLRRSSVLGYVVLFQLIKFTWVFVAFTMINTKCCPSLCGKAQYSGTGSNGSKLCKS